MPWGLNTGEVLAFSSSRTEGGALVVFFFAKSRFGWANHLLYGPVWPLEALIHLEEEADRAGYPTVVCWIMDVWMAGTDKVT